jgi:hypothetical protein
VLLSFALAMAIFGQGAAPAAVLPPPGCPAFRDAGDGALIDVASCRVTESGEFASLQGDTYFYALYCVEEKEFPLPCDDRVQRNGSIAIFVRPAGARAMRPVMAIFHTAVSCT